MPSDREIMRYVMQRWRENQLFRDRSLLEDRDERYTIDRTGGPDIFFEA